MGIRDSFQERRFRLRNPNSKDLVSARVSRSRRDNSQSMLRLGFREVRESLQDACDQEVSGRHAQSDNRNCRKRDNQCYDKTAHVSSRFPSRNGLTRSPLLDAIL